jgi:hypothetical protein
MSEKKTHSFSLVLGGVNEHTPELEEKLYAADCHDALVHFRKGTVYLDFDRQAESLEEAIISAIKAIESSPVGARVIRVGPDDIVSESDVAKRLDCPRQTVSLWIKGARRNETSFPKPIMKLSERSPLWRWSEVAAWLYQSGVISDETLMASAVLIENINAALEERDAKVKRSRGDLFKKLTASYEYVEAIA